jgi:DNA-binding PadR family transcriptional regulator
MTELEIIRIRFMDWLYDYRPAQAGTLANVGQFLSDEDRPKGDDKQVWYGIVRGLAADDLIYLNESMELQSFSVQLTPNGRMAVQKWRARRADAATRAGACRTALLRWIYGQPNHKAGADVEPFFEAAESYWEGVRFEPGEVEQALAYLEKKDLVDGTHAEEFDRQIYPFLTDAGIDCVEQYEGRVMEYLRRDEGYGVQHNVTTHFHAEVQGSNLSYGNQGDTNQTLNQVEQIAPGFEAIAQAVADILKRLPALGLPEEDLEDAQAAANEVLTEVTRAEPERRKLRRAVTALTGSLALVATGAVAGVSEGAQEVAKKAIEQLGTLVF